MSDPKKGTLIVIRAYNFQHEALIDKAKLDSAGIDCFLKNDNMEIIQPFFYTISRRYKTYGNVVRCRCSS